MQYKYSTIVAITVISGIDNDLREMLYHSDHETCCSSNYSYIYNGDNNYQATIAKLLATSNNYVCIIVNIQLANHLSRNSIAITIYHSDLVCIIMAIDMLNCDVSFSCT